MTPPTSYADVLDYIALHEAQFGFKPAAIELSSDELNAFLKVIQVQGEITSSYNGYYEGVKVAGVQVVIRRG